MTRPNRSRLLAAIICTAVTSVVCPAERTVLVRIPINAAYSNSALALARLDRALAAAPLRVVDKPAATNPEETLVNIIKFGPYKNPSASLAYKKIKNTVRTLNPGAFQTATQADLQIPALPRWAYTDWNRDKAVNYVPQITSWSATQSQVKDGRVVVSGVPTTVNSADASQSGVIEVHLTLTDALAYFDKLSTLGIPKAARLYDRTLDITLAAGECPGPEPQTVLSNDQKARIAKALLRATQGRQVFVVVADTGYPSEDAYSQSRQFAFDAIASMMKKYRLGPLPDGASNPADAFVCPLNQHVVEVSHALREFESLDSTHVKVVYFPLTKEQHSEGLLNALLRFRYLFDLTQGAIGKKIAPPTITTLEQQQHADKENRRVLDGLPPEWPAFQKQLRTDKSVLDAWLLLMQLYAQEHQTAFFLSTSWTMNHAEPTVDVPNPLRGAVVAATGNANEDIGGNVQPGIDFAQRSVSAKDTVAVMNFTNSGDPDCNSGLINSSYRTSAFAVGYLGRLFGTDCAGSATSYATPRVAWLLAAAEAVRQRPFNMYGADASMYIDSLRSGAGLQRFLLDPVTLLEKMP